MNPADLLRSFTNLKVLIIGDVMVDNYFWGRVERISPEAPVAIVALDKKDKRLGGAANVALNIQALGAKPILCSVIGDDGNGKTFLQLLEKQGLSGEGIVKDPERPTTVKTRIIGNNHQMLRVDEEVDDVISHTVSSKIFDKAEGFIKNEKIDVIIFEDYDKGLISPDLIQRIVTLAHEHNVPVAVDPKKRNFHHYKNVDLFKPNLKELKEGLKTDFENMESEIREAVDQLQHKNNIKMALVTLSEHGVYVSNGTVKKLIPAHLRNIADVSGAGDTVISVAALALAAKASPEQLAVLANLAGGLVCEKIGVVAIDKQQLMQEAENLDA